MFRCQFNQNKTCLSSDVDHQISTTITIWSGKCKPILILIRNDHDLCDRRIVWKWIYFIYPPAKVISTEQATPNITPSLWLFKFQGTAVIVRNLLTIFKTFSGLICCTSSLCVIISIFYICISKLGGGSSFVEPRISINWSIVGLKVIWLQCNPGSN